MQKLVLITSRSTPEHKTIRRILNQGKVILLKKAFQKYHKKENRSMTVISNPGSNLFSYNCIAYVLERIKGNVIIVLQTLYLYFKQLLRPEILPLINHLKHV